MDEVLVLLNLEVINNNSRCIIYYNGQLYSDMYNGAELSSLVDNLLLIKIKYILTI